MRGGIRLLLVVLATALVSGCRPRTPSEPFGVLLISVDTLRADRLNCYGYKRRQTSPAIDALARDGILFDVHIAASPWTTPSHFSMLTSKLPTHHGMVASMEDVMKAENGEQAYPRLAESQVTLAEALAAAGRDTAAFTGGATLDPRLGFDQGFALYDSSMSKLSPRRVEPLFDWIDAHRERSFFLFWHTFEVHAPYVATEFLPEVVPADTRGPLETKLQRMARRGASNRDFERALTAFRAFDLEVCNALYDGGIHSFDGYLAQVISRLRALGLYDRMLIVLTSDHGEEFGEHGNGFYGKHGHTLYEELLRVPLIIKLPGQAHAGKRVRSLTSSLDLMPTILDLVRSAARPVGMEGTSLRPLWESGAATAGRLVISEALSKGPEQKSIRSENDKLILTIPADVTAVRGRGYLPPDLAGKQLFDLASDAGEQHDFLRPGAPPTSAPARAAALEKVLRLALGQGAAKTDSTVLDPEARERLRALGYLQ